MVKIGVLIVFIVLAFFFAFNHSANSLSHFTAGVPSGDLTGIFASSVVIFFAYSGFQSISTITRNVRGGGSGAAKAIVASVLISIVLYILVVVALILMVPANLYKVSSDPLSFALKTTSAPSWLFTLISVGALVATTSATLAMVLASSRIFYQIGSDKLLPKLARAYNEKRDVAVNGVIISSVIGVIMLFSGDIYVMTSISNFGLLFSYLMASFALIHFRRTKANPSFKAPFYPYLPVAGIVGLVALLIGMPKEALLIGVAMILSLIAIYYTLIEAESGRAVKRKLFE